MYGSTEDSPGSPPVWTSTVSLRGVQYTGSAVTKKAAAADAAIKALVAGRLRARNGSPYFKHPRIDAKVRTAPNVLLKLDP